MQDARINLACIVFLQESIIAEIGITQIPERF